MVILAAVFLILIQQKEEDVVIPDDAIRFRLIASTNEIEDQALKMNIKQELLKEIIPSMSYASTKKAAEQKITESIPKIEKTLENYPVTYDVSFGLHYFPEKYYKGISYPSGNYESLVITLGKGTGDNWWCVLFPPLCMLDEEENQTGDVSYRSYVKDLLSKHNY